MIIWHLLTGPTVGFIDLGSHFYDTRIDPERHKRNHIRQLEALGDTVTLEPAAWPRRPISAAPPGAAARPLTL